MTNKTAAKSSIEVEARLADIRAMLSDPCRITPLAVKDSRLLLELVDMQSQRIAELEVERAAALFSAEDWQLKTEAFERANITLQEQVASLTKERDDALKALHDLTPGGSEFVGDVKRCVEWIRVRFTSEHEQVLKQAKEQQTAQAQVASLREALIECQTYIRIQQPIWTKVEDLPPVMHKIAAILESTKGAQ